MKILVDADACPVKDIILEMGEKFGIDVIMLVDTSHVLKSDRCTIITVDKACDSVDFAMANRTSRGDITVTQDYGLASMLLAKGAYVLHQNGFIYDDSNIDRLLFERHISKEQRRHGKRSGHIKPRSAENDAAFSICLYTLLAKLTAPPSCS